jgi:hypothetical protein
VEGKDKNDRLAQEPIVDRGRAAVRATIARVADEVVSGSAT